MNNRVTTCCWLVVAGLLAGCGGGAAPRPGTLASTLREVSGDIWQRAGSGRLGVYARRQDVADDVARRTEFYLDRVAALFDLGDAVRLQPDIYVLDDPGIWKWLTRHYELAPDAAAVLDGHDIIFLAPCNAVLESEALAHELVHYTLRQGGFHVPLALEEGLALHLGWELTLMHHLKEGRMVARGRRYAPQGPLFTIDELLQLAAYPGQPEALAAFYYQSERWVRALLEMLEAEELPVFLSAMSAGQMTWREVLEGHLGISSEQIERLARMAGGPPAP